MSGIGKRFIEAGYTTPKPLIEVDGKPIIQHIVELFNNPEDITFICNEEHINNTDMYNILKSIAPNCKIYEVPNENRKGPVDAVLQIEQHINDDKETIVSYCDYGTVWEYHKFLKEMRESNADGGIACYWGFHPHMLGSDNYAFVKTDKNNNAIEIQEKKPFTDNKMNELASNGTYYFKSGKLVKKYFKQLIDENLSVNNEFYVSLVYNLLIKDNLLVKPFLIDKMLQWGTPRDLDHYNEWARCFTNLKKKQTIISHPKNTTLILPLAGRGSRFSMEGYDKPKPLIEVDNKPMIISAVGCLPKTKNQVFICLEEHVNQYKLDETIKNYYPSSSVVSINTITEGQACTCEIGINEGNVNLDNPILISACDNGVYYDADEYQKLLDDQSIDIIVWTFRNHEASKYNKDAYAWLDVDNEGLVKHVSCKKFIYDDVTTTHAIIGTMFFRKGQYFVDGLKANYKENIRTNNEFYVDDVLNQNIKAGLKVKVFEVKNYICWGSPNDYKTYNYWKEHFNK